MQVNTQKKTVEVKMTTRETGKMAECLRGLEPIPGSLAPFAELFNDVIIPDSSRGELRHEWGALLDMDPDIGAV